MGNPRIALLLLAAGCWRTTPQEALESGDTPKSRPGLFTISKAGVGPINARTPATLDALRKLFVGYDVKPVNAATLEYDVLAHGERLLYVTTNDDASVFSVNATSDKIGVADRTWRVGHPLGDASMLTACACWAGTTACFKQGEHVAVDFNRACSGLVRASRRMLRSLESVPIHQIVWRPSGFGVGGIGPPSDGQDDFDEDNGNVDDVDGLP